MGTRLYVGNLPYSVDSSELEQMFSPHGAVRSAEVVADRDTGRSKGFGFVEMGSDEEAQAAIAALNGQENGGRASKKELEHLLDVLSAWELHKAEEQRSLLNELR